MIIFFKRGEREKAIQKTGGQNWLNGCLGKQVLIVILTLIKQLESSPACFLEVVFTFVVYLGVNFFSQTIGMGSRYDSGLFNHANLKLSVVHPHILASSEVLYIFILNLGP